jgi:hypothetical protein
MRFLAWVLLPAALVACGDSDRPAPVGFEDLGLGGSGEAPDAADPPEPAQCAPLDSSKVPVPALDGDGYQITLEGTTLSLYEGLVRAEAFYTTQPPLIADILVCNGDYENPNIKVRLSDHHYTWSYDNPEDAPKEGYIVNVHALPSTPDLAARIKAHVKLQSRVRIWGFEVDRINYAGGKYWTDSGCHTLLITHLCVEQ